MNSLEEKRKSIEGLKPFRLVKHLSLSSLMVILVCTLIISGFISQKAKEILLHKSEQYALLVAENLNHQVFFQFTLPTLITEGQIRLSRESQSERLDKVVRNTIHGFDVDRVNIYSAEQILTYSTEPETTGSRGDLGEVFERALKGESVSVLAGEDESFFLLPWKRTSQKQLKTYLPMWEERPLSWKRGKILGVFEITQDITRDYKIIQRFQLIVALSFMLFVSILFAAIFIIARRAERIIGQRAAERIRLEEQLHQTERLAALGEMIAGVSHEIRNPLGIIRSTAEMLHNRAESERQKRFTSIIVEEATRLNGILTEFLDFARPKTLKPSYCRLEEVVERNLKMLEAEFQKLGVVVHKDYHTRDYCMEADFDLLYRAFVNLFANALQSMPEGGTLSVRTGLVNGKNGSPAEVELRIEDTGHGIPGDVMKKIFNPFFTTREKGSGLGLAIVQSIIDSHHGMIEVESEEQKGTTMIVRLPLTQPESANQPQEAAG
ncbi:MAG: two-component sensor histidine kinase [Deltaproteobacteria bacterium]|nr:two-component sensor histidine kinase [Deltaproteobacteria bacterium]